MALPTSIVKEYADTPITGREKMDTKYVSEAAISVFLPSVFTKNGRIFV
jgi:hypothetical protein